MRVGVRFCPGVLHPVPAKDGLLVRIRIPGGMIDARQLRSVAGLSRAFADGTVEITSRSNLQLRAIRLQHIEALAHAIATAGLLPSRQHDRVRNITASPLAGIDKQEIVDVRPLVRELDERLQMDSRLAELDPKFSFALHGGGKRFSHDRDDIALEAIATGIGPGLQLSIAGQDSGFSVSPEDAVSCMLSLAGDCIDLSREASAPARTKHVLAQPHGLNRLLSNVAYSLLPSPREAATTLVAEALAGVQSSGHEGYVTISPIVALGRLTADQAEGLSEIALEYAGDLRLAPWRGIVLSGIRKDDSVAVVHKLEAAGLSCDETDGFRGIAACAGSTGCEASLADVRSHAVLLAERLAGSSTRPGWTVNLSGCEKQCARRHGATAEMIAGESGYVLKIEGALVASDCSPEFALNAIHAVRHNSRIEASAL